MNWIKRFSKLLFIILLACIAVLSLLPPEQIELESNDKIGHALAYLSLFITYGIWKSTQNERIQGFLWCFGFGLLMEGLQGLVPGRSPSLWDIVANTTGLLVASALFVLKSSVFAHFKHT